MADARGDVTRPKVGLEDSPKGGAMSTDAEIAERRARLLGPMRGLSDERVKQYVRETLSGLGSALSSLTGEQATWKPEESEWSVAQVGDHVALATGVMGNVTGLLAKGQAVTDADWDPPPQFRGSAADVGDVRRRLGELPGFTDRLFDEGAKTDNLDAKANNSQLGDLNWREWFYFLGVHANDHIGQIEKLRGMRAFPG
jgi:DinB superfamily